MNIIQLQRLIVDALEDVKGQDISVYNTSHITSLFDRVIIASGTSNRQTRALAASVRDKVKQAGGEILTVEGEDTGEWVLVDCGDAVVHLMQPEIRAYYRLEEVWGDKPVKIKLAGSGDRSRRMASEEEDDEPAPAAKKIAAKKVAKKAAAKKAPAKKVAAKKAAAKKVAAKKAPARKRAS